ncbi:MAG TPA: GGDEF domain-containing protein [Candidatus Nanoarchaeia archaeon]|nr:GGDEF domain-containing protein [Candidatus Nanoarchaeia archaeon]
MKKAYRQLIKRIDQSIKEIKDKELKSKIRKLLAELNNSIYEVYMMAITDKKTGVYNNYFFDTILDMELDKAKRSKKKLCLFMADIDYFKKINDTCGHFKADDMLKRLATLIVKNTRKSDVVARFGGEEFIILFPETGLNKAKQITYRIKKSVKEDIFLKKYGLTISGGLTILKERDTARKIKERVDKGLYKAKNKGRDRFIIIK